MPKAHQLSTHAQVVTQKLHNRSGSDGTGAMTHILNNSGHIQHRGTSQPTRDYIAYGEQFQHAAGENQSAIFQIDSTKDARDRHGTQVTR